MADSSRPLSYVAPIVGSQRRRPLRDPGFMDSAIRTQSLRKVYPAPPPAKRARSAAPRKEIVALEGLDLAVHAGEFFGLLGPNGAGKTTTIGILTTRVLPTAGHATVAECDVVRDAVNVRRRIGVVPQRPNPDRGLNAIENLVFHSAYFGINRHDATTRAMALLDQLGIGDRAQSKVDELSGGQQQRLMIARALIHQPTVIFLDEPTVGLDPQARLAFWEILRHLHSEGRTIVMTTHYMEEADQLCDRIAIMDRGQLLAQGTPRALKAKAPGGTFIELMVHGNAADLTEATSALPGILSVSSSRDILRVCAERPGEVISGLVHAASRTGLAITDIHLSPPSLETLFVSLTGRKLD